MNWNTWCCVMCGFDSACAPSENRTQAASVGLLSRHQFKLIQITLIRILTFQGYGI